MKNSLDFIVIGAAKSGTTTLFELVKDHPQLSIPRNKEVPFFSDEAIYHKGFEWYLNTYFGKSLNDSLWGTMTPQYMLGENATNPELVARRIKEVLPDVKLIAILRHPIKRAFSHYRMAAQRGYITKNFEKAVEDLLEDKTLGQSRLQDINEANTFLLGSEYGHILQAYYQHFKPEQILVLDAEDLKSQPENVMRSLFKFLNIDEDYQPKHTGGQFRKGGGKPKVKLLTPGYMYKLPFVKKLWQSYMPHALRKRVEYSINLWNSKPDEKTLETSSAAYKKLVAHYAPDVKLLEEVTGHKTPWKDWS